jgi:hypothetical protein
VIACHGDDGWRRKNVTATFSAPTRQRRRSISASLADDKDLAGQAMPFACSSTRRGFRPGGPSQRNRSSARPGARNPRHSVRSRSCPRGSPPCRSADRLRWFLRCHPKPRQGHVLGRGPRSPQLADLIAVQARESAVKDKGVARMSHPSSALFTAARRVAHQGAGVIFISHRTAPSLRAPPNACATAQGYCCWTSRLRCRRRSDGRDRGHGGTADVVTTSRGDPCTWHAGSLERPQMRRVGVGGGRDPGEAHGAPTGAFQTSGRRRDRR